MLFGLRMRPHPAQFHVTRQAHRRRNAFGLGLADPAQQVDVVFVNGLDAQSPATFRVCIPALISKNCSAATKIPFSRSAGSGWHNTVPPLSYRRIGQHGPCGNTRTVQSVRTHTQLPVSETAIEINSTAQKINSEPCGKPRFNCRGGPPWPPGVELDLSNKMEIDVVNRNLPSHFCLQ